MTLLEAIARTIAKAEEKGQLFVFLPDVYLEACDALTSVLIKDFSLIRPINSFKGVPIKYFTDLFYSFTIFVEGLSI